MAPGTDDIQEWSDWYNMLKNKEFIPNSPVLFNFGTAHSMGCACFGLDIKDDLKDIYKKLGWAARIFKMGGGCGFNFSNIRPKGDPVGTTNGVASGVVSFMKLFDASTEVIKQGGKRRGAAISILNVSHPEIIDFINCKSVEGDLSNFNISVMLTDAFMKAVYNDEPFDLVYEGKVYTTCRARDLYSKICAAIWKNGEPGLLFYDRINKDNPTPEFADIHVTNPCVVGETLILTDNGNVPIKDCVNKPTTVWNGWEWSEVIPEITGYNQDLMEIGFSNGSTLICTPYHKFKVWTGEEVIDKEIQDLVVGVRLALCDTPEAKHTMMTPYTKILNMKDIERKDTVYCFNEPKNHTGIFNGVYTCNCGELPIQCDPETGAGEACNLGSINLVAMLATDNSENKYIDIPKLEKTVENAVKFLDRVIDTTEFPLKGIEKMTKGNRKTGLGVMGFADMLIEMGLPYDPKNERTIAIIRDIMGVIRRVADRTSQDLAIELGEYPNIRPGNDRKTPWRRNATLMCIAPTGTISMIAGVSSGIEPNFSFVYDRKNSTGTFREVHVQFGKDLFEAAQRNSNNVSSCDILYGNVINRMHEKGTIQDVEWLSDEFKAIFKTALDIKPEDHIGIQAEFQKYVDSSISKTINCPEDTTLTDIECYVNLAYNSGLKGLTFYRQNSRNDVVLNLKKDPVPIPTPKTNTILDEYDGLVYRYSPESDMGATKKRPEGLPGHTYKAKSGCGKLYITVNTKDDAPYEVFVKTSGNGGCEANINAIGRLISIALREGVSPNVITKQLGRVCCPVALKNGCSYKGKSCPDIIGKVLGLCGNPEPTIQATLEESSPQPKEKVNIMTHPIGDWKQGTCPSCGSKVERSEGCLVCRNCGDSKC